MSHDVQLTSDATAFANALRLLRLEKRWTQAALAKRVGVSNAAVSYWEHGQLPRSDLYLRLVGLFPQLAQPSLDERFQIPPSATPTEASVKPQEMPETNPDAAAVQVVRQLLAANPDLFAAFTTAASAARVDLELFAYLVKPLP